MPVLSFAYLLLLPAVLALYWVGRSRTWQNGLLLLASLGFAASWSTSLLLVLVVSTALEWRLAHRIHTAGSPGIRRAWFWTGIVANVLLLAFFRTQDFFAPPLAALVGRLGADPQTVHILAPAGLSFWTLQKMTLTLDVHSGRIAPERNVLRFLLCVSFFPNLVAGPVERIRNLRPRFAKARTWETHRFAEGIWLLALGAFEKAVVADHVADIAKTLFAGEPGGLAILLGTLAYALQLFADFAGYSDMARGVARLFGIDLTQNFRSPYLSANLTEYWKRWHVSLSSWLDDHVFAPTSFTLRRLGTKAVLIATFVTFLVSGLWHGTGWQFLAWGMVHATGLAALILLQGPRKRLKKRWGKRRWFKGLAILLTLGWVGIGYVFFHAASLPQALGQLGTLLAGRWGNLPAFDLHVLLLSSLAVFLLHILPERTGTPFWAFRLPLWPRVALYLLLGLLLLRFHAHSTNFIYFQF